MKAELIDHMGDDLSVVNAARVSFDKESEWEWDECGVKAFGNESRQYLSDPDSRLIKYLAKHNHWTPFAHQRFTLKSSNNKPILKVVTDPTLSNCLVHNEDFTKVRHSFYGWVQLLLKGFVNTGFTADVANELGLVMPVSYAAFSMPEYGAPVGSCFISTDEDTDPLFIDVSMRMGSPYPIQTQCFKHKQGFVENGESRRYIKSTPSIHVPDRFRMTADNVKQGSGGVHVHSEKWRQRYIIQTEAAISEYEEMIEDGVCPEQARFVLPQGAILNWIWTGNLASYARFYNQRTDPHAQKEVQELSRMVGDIIAPLYPVSWEALTVS